MQHLNSKGEPKITSTDQTCRKCRGTLIQRWHKRTPVWKPGKANYYFEWWLVCTTCGTLYFVEEAKRFFGKHPTNGDLFDRTPARSFTAPSFRRDNTPVEDVTDRTQCTCRVGDGSECPFPR